MDCAPCYHRNLLLDKVLSKLSRHLECYHPLSLHHMTLIKRHGQLIPRCSHAIACIFCRIFENTRHMMHKKMRMSHVMIITSCHLHIQLSLLQQTITLLLLFHAGVTTSNYQCVFQKSLE